MWIGYDDILGFQRGRRWIVERQAVEVDGVVAHGAGETRAPLSTLWTVSGVQQAAHRHDFVVDVSWKQENRDNREVLVLVLLSEKYVQ